MAPQHGMAKVAKYDSYTYNCNFFLTHQIKFTQI